MTDHSYRMSIFLFLVLLEVVNKADAKEVLSTNDDVKQQKNVHHKWRMVSLQTNSDSHVTYQQRISSNISEHNKMIASEQETTKLRNVYRSKQERMSRMRRMANDKDLFLTDSYGFYAVTIAGAICISTIALSICIFCNACIDDKSSDVSGPNGYVGKINLADIQVIYNPSAPGVVRLPSHTHHNEAFKNSHENIILANPAVIDITSHQITNVRPSSVGITQENLYFDAKKASAWKDEKEEVKRVETRRLKDVYIEKGRTLKLEYENFYADDSAMTKNTEINYKKNGKENVEPTHKNTSTTNTQHEFFHSKKEIGKDYDMNDITLKNMHVRY